MKTHSLSISEQALTAEQSAEIAEEELVKSQLSSAAEAFSLNENERNALRTAIWVKKNWNTVYTPNPGKELEGLFSHLSAPIGKVPKQKLYKVFEPKYWSRRFQAIQHPLFDSLDTYRQTKDQNEILIRVCQSQLVKIQQITDNEDIEAIVSELYDTEFVEAFTGFHQTWRMWVFLKQKSEIISAFGSDNVGEFNELYAMCGSRSQGHEISIEVDWTQQLGPAADCT